jgi:hypothetical protein
MDQQNLSIAIANLKPPTTKLKKSNGMTTIKKKER